MELRHLRYFQVLGETLNFTRAAERLHIAQPPLSRQIQQLEDELGVILLERGRPLRLTEAGRFFMSTPMCCWSNWARFATTPGALAWGKNLARHRLCAVDAVRRIAGTHTPAAHPRWP